MYARANGVRSELTGPRYFLVSKPRHFAHQKYIAVNRLQGSQRLIYRGAHILRGRPNSLFA